jgi:hypothetical protein
MAAGCDNNCVFGICCQWIFVSAARRRPPREQPEAFYAQNDYCDESADWANNMPVSCIDLNKSHVQGLATGETQLKLVLIFMSGMCELLAGA